LSPIYLWIGTTLGIPTVIHSAMRPTFHEMLDMIVIIMHYMPREPQHTSILTEWPISMNKEGNLTKCHDIFHMYKGAFRRCRFFIN
jgi:hypothetical protein